MAHIPQRRRTARFRVGQPMQVSIETPEGRSLAGRVRDLSQGGVGLELVAQRSFHPGEELILQVEAEPAQRLLATARVVWTRPLEGAQKVGLEWTNSGPHRQRLEALVADTARLSGASVT